VQALKHAEELADIVHVEADTIVLDVLFMLPTFVHRAYFYDCRLPGTGKLDRVGK
jgi:hypothetical protein